MVIALGVGSLLWNPADAHMGTGLPGGFVSGFVHPFNGIDHLLAMVSVGLWGAFLGRPLLYVLPVVFPVKLTDLGHDASPFETHLTDHSGRASFTMPSSGKWLLNVIWTKALPHSEETDFETVFSSLSFGFLSDNS
jgi:hypothetical protein